MHLTDKLVVSVMDLDLLCFELGVKGWADHPARETLWRVLDQHLNNDGIEKPTTPTNGNT